MSAVDVKPTATQLASVIGSTMLAHESKARALFHKEHDSLEKQEKLLEQKQKAEKAILNGQKQLLRDTEKHRRLESKLLAMGNDIKPATQTRVKPEPADEEHGAIPLDQPEEESEKHAGQEELVADVLVTPTQEHRDPDDDDEIIFVEEKLLGGSTHRSRLSASVGVKTERFETPESYGNIRHPSLSPVLDSPIGETSKASHTRGIKRARGRAAGRPGPGIKPSSSSLLTDRFPASSDEEDLKDIDSHDEDPTVDEDEGQSSPVHGRKSGKMHHRKEIGLERPKPSNRVPRHRVKLEKKRTAGRRYADSSSESSDEDGASGNGDMAKTGSDEDEEEMKWSKRYNGPALTILSRKVISRYLTRVLDEYGLSTNVVSEMSQYWPKTKVQTQHDLDKAQMCLLTQSVTFWWKGLFERLSDPTHRWPKNLRQSKASKLSMRSRVEEIYYDKKKSSVRAKREMEESGKVISIDKVYHLN